MVGSVLAPCAVRPAYTYSYGVLAEAYGGCFFYFFIFFYFFAVGFDFFFIFYFLFFIFGAMMMVV